MNETSKAMRRRLCAGQAHLFAGHGIDVGCGGDPIRIAGTILFDSQPAGHISVVGDASNLAAHFPNKAFDWLHSSQCLEHLRNPVGVLFNQWLPLIRERAIITVPSWELYERMQWPSRYNPDHKATFSMWQKGSPAEWHVYMPWLVDTLKRAGWSGTTATLIDTNYDYRRTDDQTFIEADGVEAFIELIIQK